MDEQIAAMGQQIAAMDQELGLVKQNVVQSEARIMAKIDYS